jgi:two-component system cell cycle response regulator DivK
MRILVAEDFDDTRLMMRLLLEMSGHGVLEAADGREAVLLAEREHPDLVLMDLNMPVLDGIEATRLLHGRPATASLPVVAVTAHCADSEWRERALEAGCVECMGKPLDFSKLEELIDNMPGRSSR